MEPDGPGLLFDDAVALFGREVAVDFPWVSPSRLLPKSGLAGGDVFPMVAFATSWWYCSLGNSSWRAMVTALPHQRWVTLERSAPGRGGEGRGLPTIAAAVVVVAGRRVASARSSRLGPRTAERMLCLEQGPSPLRPPHTCTTATALSAVPSRGCQSELDGRPPGFTLHPAIKKTCSPGSLSKHGFMPPSESVLYFLRSAARSMTWHDLDGYTPAAERDLGDCQT